MPTPLSKTMFTLLVIGFIVYQPILVLGIERSGSRQPSSPKVRKLNQISEANKADLLITTNVTLRTANSLQPEPAANLLPTGSTSAQEGQTKQANDRKVIAHRKVTTGRSSATSGTKRTRKTMAHHRSSAILVNGDCDACHQQCLIAGLACIALSIVTACAPCGPICLAAQAGCQMICNRTSACNPAEPGGPPVKKQEPIYN